MSKVQELMDLYRDFETASAAFKATPRTDTACAAHVAYKAIKAFLGKDTKLYEPIPGLSKSQRRDFEKFGPRKKLEIASDLTS